MSVLPIKSTKPKFYTQTLLLLCLILTCCSSISFAQDKLQGKLLNFADILKITYQNNPSLQAARQELLATRELHPQARAGWRPTITGETQLFSTRIESSNFSEGTGASTKDITLRIEQPIWSGGQNFAESARARDLIRAGEAILMRAEQDIFLDTITAYIDLIRDKDILALRYQNEDILRKERNAARERFDIGDVTQTDVEQAKARLARAHSRRIRAKNALDITMLQFVEITGVQMPAILKTPKLKVPFPQQVKTMINLAEAQNPDLIIAQFQARAAEHDIQSQFRALLPQISAFASLNRQFDPQPGIVAESETDIIGIRASLALYEGGAARSRMREAQRNAKRREYEIEVTRRRIIQNLQSNLQSYKAAKAEAKSRLDEVTATKKSLDGVREEARAGQRSILDILDADQEMIDAKVASSRSKRDQDVAYFALANSLGLLLPENIIQDFHHYNFVFE